MGMFLHLNQSPQHWLYKVTEKLWTFCSLFFWHICIDVVSVNISFLFIYINAFSHTARTGPNDLHINDKLVFARLTGLSFLSRCLGDENSVAPSILLPHPFFPLPLWLSDCFLSYSVSTFLVQGFFLLLQSQVLPKGDPFLHQNSIPLSPLTWDCVKHKIQKRNMAVSCEPCAWFWISKILQ